jgi:hypothetical protein
LTELIADALIEKDIEQLMNLCHPSIPPPIAFVFTAGVRELKVLVFYSESE